MKRKVLSIAGIALIILAVQACSSSPEKSLLKSYFHAIALNDAQTMSTMSLDPLKIEVSNWEITSVTEEKIETTTLPELNKQEMDLKKQLEESVGVTLDASDALDNAKFEHENARTRSARRAAQKKIDELQAKYDEIYAKHKELQKQYNEAKAASQQEEGITLFSLGAGELPNVRDFTGDVHSKEVDLKCTMIDSTLKNYKVSMRKYVLKDEAAGLTRRGRWIIVKFKPV